MGVWKGSIYFADRRGRRTVQVSFPNAAGVFDGAEFLSVKAAVAGIASAMAAATETSVGHSLTFYEEPVNVAGLATTVDKFDTLQLVTYVDALDPSGNPKTWTFPLPAPVEATIINGGDADINDALLTAIMSAMQTADALGFRVSDGESIDFSLGNTGLKTGRWLSKAGN